MPTNQLFLLSSDETGGVVTHNAIFLQKNVVISSSNTKKPDLQHFLPRERSFCLIKLSEIFVRHLTGQPGASETKPQIK